MGDIAGAQAAAEEASLLDVDDTQVMMVLDEVTARQRDLEFHEHVEAAQGHLDADALTDALTRVDQALEIQPTASMALDLRGDVMRAFEDRDRKRERTRQVDGILTEARRALADELPDVALRSASEVLAFEPGHAEAGRLKEQALAAVEERRRAQDVERTAQRAVDVARQEFADGDHTAAFERLERLGEHPAVAATLAELRREAESIEHRLLSDEAKRDRSAAWVDEQIATIRNAMSGERWTDASAQLQELRRRAPDTPALPDLAGSLREAQVAAGRRSEVEEYLASARRRKASGDYPAALSRVDAALALWPDHAEALALHQEIDELASTESARREAEAAASRKAAREAVQVWLDTADEALRAGRSTEALKALEDVDLGAATTTQSVRYKELATDAEAHRARARVEATQQRRERLARAIGAERRVQAGLLVGIGLLAVTGWVLSSPATPVPDAAPASTAARSLSPSSSPPLAPAVAAADADDVPVDSADEADGRARAETTPPEEAASPVVAPVDPVEAELAVIARLSRDGDHASARGRLARLEAGDPRVARAGSRLDREWNAAARETADQARRLADEGDFGAAVSLVREFQPEHGFVQAAAEDVERAWRAAGAELSRQALLLASEGDHAGAVALLEASDPPHPTVTATLAELRDNPDCSDQVPAVRDALSSFTLDRGVVPPASVSACDGSFRVEIQNERVRFGGVGCSRASATAFVPVLCEGSAEWSQPSALRFGLRKSGETWSISDVDEINTTER